MKYFLLIAFMACGYGQYPSLNYMKYYNNRYGQTKKDTTPIKIYIDLDTFDSKPNGTVVGVEPDGSNTKIGDTAYRYLPNSWDKQTLVLKSTKKYPNGTWEPINQFDSSKFYNEKQNYWQKKMDKESRRLDRLKTPQISQKLLDYQDSLIHYQLLLLKKIKNGSK